VDIASQIVVKRAKLVEVSLAGVQTIGAGVVVNLEYPEDLRGKLVYGVEAVCSNILAVSPTNRPVIAPADAAFVLVDLVEQQTNLHFLKQYPANRLRPELFNGTTIYFRPRFPDYRQCELRLTGAGTLANTQSIMLLIYYKMPNE
jgi:hypothetical protein